MCVDGALPFPFHLPRMNRPAALGLIDLFPSLYASIYIHNRTQSLKVKREALQSTQQEEGEGKEASLVEIPDPPCYGTGSVDEVNPVSHICVWTSERERARGRRVALYLLAEAHADIDRWTRSCGAAWSFLSFPSHHGNIFYITGGV